MNANLLIVEMVACPCCGAETEANPEINDWCEDCTLNALWLATERLARAK